jgi:hypothetical protein
MLPLPTRAALLLLQNASADQAKQRAEELSRKKEATQTDLEKAKQEADKFASLAQDARAEAEKKMQALSLDSSQLDKVHPSACCYVWHGKCFAGVFAPNCLSACH